MATTEHPIVYLDSEEEFDVLRYDENDLRAGTIYRIQPYDDIDGTYGYSPNGVGVYWYDSMDELVEDLG